MKSFTHANSGNIMQVETSMFAMSFKKPTLSIPYEFHTPTCEQDLVLPFSYMLLASRFLSSIGCFPLAFLSFLYF